MNTFFRLILDPANAVAWSRSHRVTARVRVSTFRDPHGADVEHERARRLALAHARRGTARAWSASRLDQRQPTSAGEIPVEEIAEFSSIFGEDGEMQAERTWVIRKLP